MRSVTRFLLLIFFACAGGVAWSAGGEEATRPIVFGTAQRFTPKEGAAQQLDDAAFDQDLAEIVAKAAGLPYRIAEFQRAPDLLAAFERGDVDVIPSMARLPERMGQYLFSVRHTVSTSAVFMREGRKPPESEAQVATLRLAAMRDSSGASFLRRKGWLDHTQLLDTTEEAMQAVASGRADAGISNQLVGLSVLRHLRLDDQIVPVFTLPGSSVDFCMVVRLDRGELLTRLNDGLLIASERGDLQRHREKWLPAFESYWASRVNLQRWLRFGGGTALLLAAAAWCFYRIRLRAAQARAAEIARQVERRTLELAEAIEKLRASEEALRRLNAELEQRVADRTGELARRVAEVEHLNGELEAFSYSVSHDLRAPLRNITGFLELLTRRAAGRLDAEGDRFVATVTAEAKRLGALIDDLLAFSRFGRMELKTQRVALDELIADVRGQMQLELEGRKIEWIVGALPAVTGDHALLRQVVANLLGNAVKFTRHRVPAIIEVGVAPESPGDGMVTFLVRDNGAGFNPKYADKLFGVFQRLHNQRDFEGSGIGLANVKRIVERHGGTVRGEGKIDKGAVFYLKLKAYPL